MSKLARRAAFALPTSSLFVYRVSQASLRFTCSTMEAIATPTTPALNSTPVLKRPLSASTTPVPEPKFSSVPADTLKVKFLSEHATLPTRGTSESAGYDLYSAYDTTIAARGRGIVKTDISIAIPPSTYARIAPRSGLATKKGIDTGAGVVDYDYRGPVGVVLFNHADEDFVVKKGDRIAQLILERIATPEIVEVSELDDTIRGEKGFGSTGVSATKRGKVAPDAMPENQDSVDKGARILQEIDTNVEAANQ